MISRAAVSMTRLFLFPRKMGYNHSHVIKKIKGKYTVLSETTGRSFGSYRTLAEAKRRLRQVEFFKHLSKSKRRKA